MQNNIFLLPWANMKHELSIGRVSIWPATDDNLAARIPPKAHERLRAFLSSHVSSRGIPVTSAAIVSIGENPVAPVDAPTTIEIRRAIDALIFTSVAYGTHVGVCMNNRSFGPPTSDRYELVRWQFASDSDSFSVASGQNTHGGLRLGEIQFQEPWSLGGANDKPHIAALTALGSILRDSPLAGHRERIFRALEWFRMSQTGSDSVSWHARVVMLATTFEVFLQLPRWKKSLKFAEEVVDRGLSKGLDTDPITVAGKRRQLARPSLWALSFYDLRSRIVHGDAVDQRSLRCLSSSVSWHSHLVIAVGMLWQIALRDFLAIGALQSSSGNHAEDDAGNGSLDSAMARQLEKSCFEYSSGIREFYARIGFIDEDPIRV